MTKTLVSEKTHLQSQGLPPNQQVSEVTPPHSTQLAPEVPTQVICPVAEPTQHSIMGLPIVHLSLALKDPPWTLLTQRGIFPMAETICQSSQTFAGRLGSFQVKLAGSNPGAVGHSDSIRGLSHPPHVTSPPALSTLQPSPVQRGHCSTGGRDTISPAEAGHLPNPNHKGGVLLQQFIAPKKMGVRDLSST